MTLMSKMESTQWLEWICSTEDADALRDNYDQWAVTYENDVADVWKPVPIAAAAMLSTHLADKQATILDVGAGTGLAGLALHALGFSKITGIDISSAMLGKAAAKNVYASLVCCSINDETFSKLNQADGIIATGVFADNHAGKVELEILAKTIRPGGILIFTARNNFLNTIQDVLDQPGWDRIDAKVMPIYEDPVHLLAYKIQ